MIKDDISVNYLSEDDLSVRRVEMLQTFSRCMPRLRSPYTMGYGYHVYNFLPALYFLFFG